MALVGALSGAAKGAMCIRMTLSPPSPEVGQVAILEITTFVPYLDGSGELQIKPETLPTYPFRVRAIRPDGEAVTVPVEKSRRDPKLYVGHILIDRVGEWQVHVLNFEAEGGPEEARCYSDLRAMVRDAPGSSHGWEATIGGWRFFMPVILAGAVVVTLIVWRVRRMSPSE